MEHLTNTELFKLIDRLEKDIDDGVKTNRQRNILVRKQSLAFEELANRGVSFYTGGMIERAREAD